MTFPDGYARRVLAEVDSTNAYAARIARDVSGPTWILAIKQTAARGRRGRAWQNPTGNFAATLLIAPDASPDRLALRSFVASLALRDAVRLATGRTDGLTLKWPNDVLLNGGKLAGILLETIPVKGASQSYQLAIGIGVNLASAPDPKDVETTALRPVSLLSETGTHISPEEFLDLLATSYAKWESTFATFGFSSIREAWLNDAARLGQTITARLPNQEITGTFETLDDSGQLILQTAKGRHAVAAADIFF